MIDTARTVWDRALGRRPPPVPPLEELAPLQLGPRHRRAQQLEERLLADGRQLSWFRGEGGWTSTLWVGEPMQSELNALAPEFQELYLERQRQAASRRPRKCQSGAGGSRPSLSSRCPRRPSGWPSIPAGAVRP
jgi:hypothetical protein